MKHLILSTLLMTSITSFANFQKITPLEFQRHLSDSLSKNPESNLYKRFKSTNTSLNRVTLNEDFKNQANETNDKTLIDDCSSKIIDTTETAIVSTQKDYSKDETYFISISTPEHLNLQLIPSKEAVNKCYKVFVDKTRNFPLMNSSQVDLINKKFDKYAYIKKVNFIDADLLSMVQDCSPGEFSQVNLDSVKLYLDAKNNLLMLKQVCVMAAEYPGMANKQIEDQENTYIIDISDFPLIQSQTRATKISILAQDNKNINGTYEFSRTYEHQILPGLLNPISIDQSKILRNRTELFDYIDFSF